MSFIDEPVPNSAPMASPAVPYVSLEPFIYATLVFFLLFRTRIFQSAALSMIAAWFVSYAFYFFLQSFMDRPQLTGNDPLIQLQRRLYGAEARA